jgi:hypothetical protein
MDLTLIGLAFLVFTGLSYACYATGALLKQKQNRVIESIGKCYAEIFTWRVILVLLLSIVTFVLILLSWQVKSHAADQAKSLQEKIKAEFDSAANWKAPHPAYIMKSPHKDLLLYGRQLISNTAEYLGPQGIIKPMSNGMNCQNCHLDAGTKLLEIIIPLCWPTIPKSEPVRVQRKPSANALMIVFNGASTGIP